MTDLRDRKCTGAPRRLFGSMIGIPLCILMIGAYADQPGSAAAVESRMSFVEKLVFESSAAANIEYSGNPQAEEIRRLAEQHFERAREFRDAGNFPAAEAALNDSIRAMQKAVQSLDEPGIASDKEREDFATRRGTVEAMLAAHRRISEEKGTMSRHRELRVSIERQLEASDEQLNSGRTGEAQASLDAVYQEVTAAVEVLRNGDTLIRELNFATEEDEYLYELDRNDTHQMLIQVLLTERMEDERLRSTADDFIAKAHTLRDEAEKAAAKRRHAEAITLLERSTTELIRAIRSAGIYIPG